LCADDGVGRNWGVKVSSGVRQIDVGRRPEETLMRVSSGVRPTAGNLILRPWAG